MTLRTQYLILFWLLIVAVIATIISAFTVAQLWIAVIFNCWLIWVFRRMAIKLGWTKDVPNQTDPSEPKVSSHDPHKD